MSSTTLDKLGNNNRWFFWIILSIVAFIILTTVWVVFSENAHNKVKVSYAKAFVEFTKIDFTKPSASNNTEEVVKLLQDVISFKSSSIENSLAIYNLAQIRLMQDNKEETIILLEKLVDAPKQFTAKSQALINLARLYAQKDRLKKAIAITQKVLKSTKQEEVKNLSLFDLGLYYSKNNQIEKAISSYKTISKDSSLKTQAVQNIVLLEALSSKK